MGWNRNPGGRFGCCCELVDESSVLSMVVIIITKVVVVHYVVVVGLFQWLLLLSLVYGVYTVHA